MASVTGDLFIDFTGLGDVDPYTNASLDAFGNGTRILSGSLRGNAGETGFVSNSTVTDSEDLESKVKFNSGHTSGDPNGPALLNSSGNGYFLRCNLTETRIYIVAAYVVGARIGGTTNGSSTAGDDVSLNIKESDGTITSYHNGSQIEQITDTTYTGLKAGYIYDFQNNRNAGIDEWAADGYTPASGGFLNRNLFWDNY